MPTAPIREYRLDIDGLRAIAVLGVILYHGGVPLISGGFTGVDIFFVISGYLIGGHIYGELRTGTFSYLRFYQRRAKRILPAFLAVLVFTLVASLFLFSPSEAADLGRSAFAATLSASNILFYRTGNYFEPLSGLNPLLMTWSLGVEEQFYAVIPLAMVIVVRIKRSLLTPVIVGGCLLSISLAALGLTKHPAFVFYMLPARAWELGVGVALAVTQLNRKRTSMPGLVIEGASLAGTALIMIPFFLLTRATPFPGLAALPSVLGSASILATPRSWINCRVLSMLPLVFIGRVSYSWYLWHWPLLAFARILYGDTLRPTVSALVILIAFAAAVLSYFFIEQPLRRSSRAPAALLLRYAGLSGLSLAVCAAIWLSDGVPQRFPALLQTGAESAKKSLQQDPCLLDPYGASEPNRSPACYDASLAHPGVVIWGDSHAAALAPGIRSAATAQGYGFVEFAKAGCPPLMGAVPYNLGNLSSRTSCPQFNLSALSLLESDRNIEIVILSAFWEAWLVPHDSQERFGSTASGWLTTDSTNGHEPLTPEATRSLIMKSLAATIRSLRAAGKQVIVFEDVPNFAVDPVLRVRTSRIPVRHSLATWLGTQDASDPGFASPEMTSETSMITADLEQVVASFPGVFLVDLRPNLCHGALQCMYRNQDRVLYLDQDHLTADGARFALRGFLIHAPLVADQVTGNIPAGQGNTAEAHGVFPMAETHE